MFVSVFVQVGSGCGIICAVPFEAVARVRGHTVMGAVVDGEIECYGGIAAHSVQGVKSGDGGVCEVGGAMPYERVAGGEGNDGV